MLPKIVRKNKRRREIALCAIDLIAENGLSKTSVDTIASAAGVGKGTVYLYFNSKEEIMIEIWDYVCELRDKQRVFKYEEAQNIFEKISIFFDYSVLEENQLINKIIKLFAMHISTVLTSQEKKLQEHYEKRVREDIYQLKELFYEGIKSGELKEFDVDLMAKIYESMFKGTIINILCRKGDLQDIRDSFFRKRDLIFSLIKKDSYE